MSNFVNNFTPRVMMGAAIVGIVGAAGVFIYEQLYAEKRRTMLVTEVQRLDKQVTSMRSELEALRELQRESANRRLKARKPPRPKKTRAPTAAPAAERPAGDADAVDGVEHSYASDSEYFTDYQSVLGTDGELDSEEFYDINTDDEEDDTLREEKRNGHATPLEEDLPLDNLNIEKTPSAPNSPQKGTT